MNFSRRGFMGAGAALFASAALPSRGAVIQGFDETDAGELQDKPWEPFSDKKVRVGIAGEGVCDFGSQFGYQNHPNVEVVAVTDLDPEKCRLLQERTKAPKTYPSCEEMIKNASKDKLDAVYIATDAPSHARLVIMAFDHGLNVCSAVPAFLGADQIPLVAEMLDAQKRSGKLYMMNETSAFRANCYAMRKYYEAGLLGDLSIAEGEYFHPGEGDFDSKHEIGSYNGWREGLPPQYYPTHSNGYYTCVTHKRFTRVTCQAMPSPYRAYNLPNRYNNRFRSEFALFRCEDGATARMTVAWDLPAHGYESGRVYGTKGSVDGNGKYRGWFEKEAAAIDVRKPQLPPGMVPGPHGGSHGYLTDDFIRGILVPGHKVCMDMVTSINTTIAGVYAHLSAMKDGESLAIPQVSI